MVKKKEKIKKQVQEETSIQQIVNHYFYSKGLSLEKIKDDAKKQKIIYSRFTRPAKQLLELSDSVEVAKIAIDKVSNWANSRKLDYTIETVLKKWLEIDKLKPKEEKKKPYYRGDPMIYSERKKKWFVINDDGDWLEFAGEEADINWKKIK